MASFSLTYQNIGKPTPILNSKIKMEMTQNSLFLILIAGFILFFRYRLSTTHFSRQNVKLVFVRVNRFLLILFFIALTASAFGQNYVSNGNGAWTTGANWQGGSAPTTNGQNWGYAMINHNLTITGNYDFRASTTISGVKYGLEIAANKTLQVNGNFSISNGAIVNVYGTLNITGNATLNAEFYIHPGGKVVVDGDLTIINAPYLKVGTNVAPGSYADLVVKKNLISQNSGDITIERNGRVAIFKNFTSDTAGGTLMDIKNGGQVYIDGNIALAGGSDAVANGNGTTPIGFYVNGTSTATGGGSSISANRGNKATMYTNDRPFYDWVALQNTVLPITLVYFKVDGITAEGVSLTWSTASEENFDKFIVERSADGLIYQPIAEVTGAGTTKVAQIYSHTDNRALVGKSYYRLKSVDFDNSFEYSKVLYVEFAGNKDFSIYPNPSTGESVNYRLNFDPQENDRIAIIDFSGFEVATAFVSQLNGEIIFSNPLKKGTYILKYTSTHFQKVERLVIK